jgi:hypothetical protein
MKTVILLTNSVGGELARRVLEFTEAEDEIAGMVIAEALIQLVRETGRLCAGDTFTITEDAA